MNTDLKQVPACEVMTKDPAWATADESLRAAALRMHSRGVRALLVAGDRAIETEAIIAAPQAT